MPTIAAIIFSKETDLRFTCNVEDFSPSNLGIACDVLCMKLNNPDLRRSTLFQDVLAYIRKPNRKLELTGKTFATDQEMMVVRFHPDNNVGRINCDLVAIVSLELLYRFKKGLMTPTLYTFGKREGMSEALETLAKIDHIRLQAHEWDPELVSALNS
jgi:hypothetical protein